MSNLVKLTSVAVAALALPTLANASDYYNYASHDAHQQCIKSENNKKVLGSVIGGVAGSFLGKELAADNTKTEGAVLGALVGGTAGFGLADKTVDCDPQYTTRSYPQTTYQSSTYTSPSYSSPSYSQTTYVQPTYTASTYSQPTYTRTYAQPTTYSSGSYSHAASYPSRVIVSDHPVYSQPTYSTASYRTVSAPTYVSSHPRRVSSHHAHPTRARIVTRSYSPAPSLHYHGKYACTGGH